MIKDGNDTLDDLLLLNADKMPLAQFNPDRGITRRPNQSSRKEYSKKQQHSEQSTSTESDDATTTLLDDWDEWFDSPPTSEVDSD